MKEIIEYILAFLIIMSVLSAFITVSTSASYNRLYYVPTSVVHSFASDVEESLSRKSIQDLNNPEETFSELRTLYGDFHYRITLTSLHIAENPYAIVLNNSNGDYLYWHGNRIHVRVPEPSNVTLIPIKLRSGHAREPDPVSEIVEDEWEYTHSGGSGCGRSVAIAVMDPISTSENIYIAYAFKNNKFLESYFGFMNGGLKVLINKEGPDGESIGLKSCHDHGESHLSYMVLLGSNGIVRIEQVYIKYSGYETNQYYYFDVYWDEDCNNKITEVNGLILSIVPRRPQHIINPCKYDIIALPMPSSVLTESFEVVYGDVPPEELPKGTYEFISYIDGIPVLVRVTLWRASV